MSPRIISPLSTQPPRHCSRRRMTCSELSSRCKRHSRRQPARKNNCTSSSVTLSTSLARPNTSAVTTKNGCWRRSLIVNLSRTSLSKDSSRWRRLSNGSRVTLIRWLRKWSCPSTLTSSGCVFKKSLSRSSAMSLKPGKLSWSAHLTRFTSSVDSSRSLKQRLKETSTNTRSLCQR